MYTFVAVVGILVFLVVGHELGHFVAAKVFRVRVEEFGIGYPPRAFTFGRWHETEYTFNWLPFGGFVRLWGENQNTSDPRGFFVAPAYVKIIILCAGVVMNLFMAWVLYACALHMGVPHEIDSTSGEAGALIVTEVYPGSPAGSAGIKAGDTIVAVHDEKEKTIAVLNPTALTAYVRAHAGTRMEMTYIHAGATSSAWVTPVNAVIPGSPAQAAIGIGMRQVATHSLPWGQVWWPAVLDTRTALVSVGGGLIDMWKMFLTGSLDVNQLVGPVGLVGVTHDAAESGFGTVLALAAFISVNLALINSIPLPALDGGRVFLIFVELVIRRPIPVMLVQGINMIGVGLILWLMVVVTYHDLVRLFV